MATIDRKSEREKRRAILEGIAGGELDAQTRAALENAETVREASRYMRQMRERAGLSQKQLGDRLGVTQPRISELERGDSPEGMSYALLRRAAKACGFADWPLSPLGPSVAVTPRPTEPLTTAVKEGEPEWMIDPFTRVRAFASASAQLKVALGGITLNNPVQALIDMGAAKQGKIWTFIGESPNATTPSANPYASERAAMVMAMSKVDCAIMVISPDFSADEAKGIDQIKIISDALNSAPGIKVVTSK